MALCHITGTVYLPSGEVAANRRVEFYKLSQSDVTADYLGAVVPEVVTARLDSNGEIDVRLITGNYFGRVLDRNGKRSFEFNAAVPEQASAEFSDIIAAADPVEPLPSWLQQAFEARDDAFDAVALAEQAALDADGSAQRASDAADLTVEIAGNVMYLDTYEAESIAYFNRCAVPPSFALRNALDGMIKRLKAAGIWPKLDALWVLSSETKQAAYLNLVQDAYNLTEVNGAGITFIPSVGVRGNGVDAYLSTGFNPATAVGAQFQRLSASLGIAPIDGGQISGGCIGNSASFISPRRTTDVADFMVNGTIGGAVPLRPSGLGFWVSTRTGSAGSTNLLYKDGVPLTPVNVPGDAANALENTEIRLLGRGGTVNTVTGRGLSLAFIGGALSASDVGAFYDAIQ